MKIKKETLDLLDWEFFVGMFVVLGGLISVGFLLYGLISITPNKPDTVTTGRTPTGRNLNGVRNPKGFRKYSL